MRSNEVLIVTSGAAHTINFRAESLVEKDNTLFLSAMQLVLKIRLVKTPTRCLAYLRASHLCNDISYPHSISWTIVPLNICDFKQKKMNCKAFYPDKNKIVFHFSVLSPCQTSTPDQSHVFVNIIRLVIQPCLLSELA